MRKAFVLEGQDLDSLQISTRVVERVTGHEAVEMVYLPDGPFSSGGDDFHDVSGQRLEEGTSDLTEMGRERIV